MDHSGAWRVPDLVAGTPDALAEIGLFHVHEEVLVEAAELLQDAPPDHERRAAEPVDRARLGCPRLDHANLPQGQGEDGAGGGRREPPRRLARVPVVVIDPRSDDRRLGASVQKRLEGVDRSRWDDGVVVQDEHVAARGRVDDPVVVRPEPRSERLLDHANLGLLGANRLDGSVPRAVVEHDDLHRRAPLRVPRQRLETRERALIVQVVDDGDSDVDLGQRRYSPGFASRAPEGRSMIVRALRPTAPPATHWCLTPNRRRRPASLRDAFGSTRVARDGVAVRMS